MANPIAVGIDFSPASRQAVEVAARLARDGGRPLVLVHATHAPTLGWAASQEHLDAIQEVLAELEMDNVVQLSERWANPLRAQGIDVETVHAEGRPSTVLTQVAKERDAFLVVVGHHGWGAVKRFFLGSVAKEVLDDSPVPVLVVPQRRA